MRPSRSRPPCFADAAPLLEEEGDITVQALIAQGSTHSALIGRWFGPDSPPTMTHWMSERSRFSGPRSGSADTKRTAAGTLRSSETRQAWS